MKYRRGRLLLLEQQQILLCCELEGNVDRAFLEQLLRGFVVSKLSLRGIGVRSFDGGLTGWGVGLVEFL